MEDKERASDALRRTREAVEDFRLCHEQSVEAVLLLGKLMKSHYDGLVESGFTKAEALAIICARGVS